MYYFASENVQKWFIWGYWLSPLMYGQNAIAVNEFLGNSWKKVATFFVPFCRGSLFFKKNNNSKFGTKYQ